MSTTDRAMRAGWRTQLALFAFAVLFRSLASRNVFDRDRVVFYGNDAYYHMRRVVYSLASFPERIDFDPFLAWPRGARAIWPPAFDALVALLASPAYALAGARGAEIAAALVPPLLGALGVLALYAAVRAVEGEAVARVAGALACLLPGLTWYGQVGFVDHHVAVSSLAAALLAVAVRAAGPSASTLRACVLVSALEAISILVWPGAVLHVALIELGLLVAWSAASRPGFVAALRARALGHAVAFAIVTPFCLEPPGAPWNAYSATVLSRFQPWLFGAAAVHAALLGAYARRLGADAAAERLVAALCLALAIAGLSGLAAPDFLVAASEAWQWFARSESFQNVVSESLPLLAPRDGFALDVLLSKLSLFGLLFPLLLVAYVRDARERADAGARAVVACFALGAAVAALAQKRFAGEAALGVAWLGAWATMRLARALRARFGPARANALAALAALAMALPSLAAHARSLELGFGGSRELVAPQRSKRNLLEAAAWMRKAAGLPLEAAPSIEPPAFGVMAPWEHGHVVLYVAGLPVVASNFGDDIGASEFERHREYFRSAEPRAARILDDSRARFVLVESLSAADRDRLGPRTMLRRLTEPALVGLAHHRLRHATCAADVAPGVAAYRVFERVAGATIAGRAEPGASVEASLELSEMGTAAVARARADDRGTYEIRISQASEDASGRPWIVRSNGGEVQVEVGVEAVLGGERVDAPALSPRDLPIEP